MTRNQRSAPDRQGTTATSTTWNARRWRRAAHRATNLSHAQVRLVLLLQEEFSDWRTGGSIYAAESTIAEAFGADRTTVRGHMKALRAGGWIIQTRPATKREPAHYRLNEGPHRPIPERPETLGNPTSETLENPTSETLENPTSDVGKSNVETLGNPTQSMSLPMPSSSSSAPAPREPEPTPGRGSAEEEEDTDFTTLMKRWPNPRARSGVAREYARDAWEDVTRRGLPSSAVLVHLRRDVADGTLTRDSWPDAWLRENWPVEQIDRDRRRAEADEQRALTAACPECDPQGWRVVDDRGTIARCRHDGITAAPAPRRETDLGDPWANVPLIRLDDSDRRAS